MASQDSASPAREPVVPSQSQGPALKSGGLGAQVRIWFLVLVLALVAGVAAWLAGEFTLDYFKPSEEAASAPYDFRALNREMAEVGAYNGAVAFGTLGGLLGLGLGLAGGLIRRSAGGALLGAIVGLILGTAAGALPSFVLMPWHWRHRNDDPSATLLLTPLLLHLGLWCAIGLGAGLAFAVGSGASKPSRYFEMALAGVVGAMVGTFVYEMVGAFVFPMDRTVEPFAATAGTRLLARLCVAGFVGLGAVRSLPPRPAPSKGVAHDLS
jgi:hypothetical protein